VVIQEPKGDEGKWVDQVLPATQITYAGSTIGLGGVFRGNASYQRVGNRVRMRRCDLTLQLYPSTTLANHTSPPTVIRIVVFVDLQSNNNLAPTLAFSDVCQDTNPAGTTTSIATSGINENYRDRFVILRDWLVPCPMYSTNLSGAVYWMDQSARTYKPLINERIDLEGLTTWYSGNTGGGADITRGRLAFVCASYYPNQVANTTPANWSLIGKSRLYFADTRY